MEFTKRHDFKISENLDGDWVIFYRRNCWLCPFIHTVKGILVDGKVGTVIFGSEMDARLYLRQVCEKFDTITAYHKWVESELNKRTLS